MPGFCKARRTRPLATHRTPPHPPSGKRLVLVAMLSCSRRLSKTQPWAPEAYAWGSGIGEGCRWAHYPDLKEQAEEAAFRFDP
jgi:hypothetical protein